MCILFFLIFVLAGCHRVYKKQQALQDIDDSAFDPKAVYYEIGRASCRERV